MCTDMTALAHFSDIIPLARAPIPNIRMRNVRIASIVASCAQKYS